MPEISSAAIETVQLFVRKSAHVTEYAVLAALLLRGLRAGAKARVWWATLALVAAVVYAALDEFHQSFVASRTASPRDVLIDSCGALIGLAVYWMLSARTALAAANQQSTSSTQK